MRNTLVGAALLAGSLSAAPAAADPVPLADALAAVSHACRASRDALLGSGATVTAGDERLAVSPAGFQLGGVLNRVVQPGVGTYGLVADDGLRPVQRRRAWRYLRQPATDWWLDAGRFWSPGQGWAATFEQSRDAVVTIDGTCTQALSGTAGPVEHSGDSWHFSRPGAAAITVVTDGHGRLAAWASTRYDYGIPTVTAPTGTVVAHQSWLKASQAASLNTDLRAMTRQVARVVNTGVPSVAAIDAAARASTPGERVVPVRVRQLRRGVLFHGRNPYTKAYHAWRVYLKGGEAVARRVAP